MEAALETLLRDRIKDACGRSTDRPVGQACRLVLLGAPGVGKGTQAELLMKRFGACHLSTGSLFRSARRRPASELTPGMITALEFMHRGLLVPDSIVVKVVADCTEELTCSRGFLLDGFPRTIPQAEALDQILGRHALSLDAVIDYELPRVEILARISGRRLCSGCGASYHVQSRPPAAEGVCDQCGAFLYQRDDDRPEAIEVRLETYVRQTAPLIDFYRGQGLLIKVQCGPTPDVTFHRTLTALGEASA